MTARIAQSKNDHVSRARDTVVIELDTAQVDQVVRAAADGGSMSVLLAGIGEIGETLSRTLAGENSSQLEDPRLSRSLLWGLLVLASLPNDGSYTGVADIARATGMNMSTAHRYISTLLVAGLLQRDPATRKYRRVGDMRASEAASTE
jgi:hypothetical protein